MKINAFPTRSLSLSLSLAQSTELLIYENTAHTSAAVGVGVGVGVADWSGRSQTVWNHQLRAPLGGSLLGQICAQISCSLPSLSVSLCSSLFGCALKSYAFHTKSSSQSNDSRHFIRGGWSMARSLESLVCVCLGLGGFALVVFLSCCLALFWSQNSLNFEQNFDSCHSVAFEIPWNCGATTEGRSS